MQDSLAPAGSSPRLHQRRGQRDEAGGVAAGHGDAGGGFQRGARAVQLRQAVDPAGGGAVRRGGIQHAHGRVDVRHDLARGGVRQAEESDVAAVDGVDAGGQVLALLAFQHAHGQRLGFGALGQPLDDAQAGGPGRTVDEDLYRHKLLPSRQQRRIKIQEACGI